MEAALYTPGTLAVRTTRRLPVAGTTLQWDDRRGVYQAVQAPMISKALPPSSFRLRRVDTTTTRTHPYRTTGEICLAPGVLRQAIVWEREAARLVFALNPVLLRDCAAGESPRATGELRWLPCQEQSESSAPSVSPVLLGHAPAEVRGLEPVTIVPCFQVGDPLLDHIALVLQSSIEAQDEAEQLYAETLATALVIHFLRRYTARQGTRQDEGASPAGFPPYKLQRTLAYIEAHLEESLDIRRLASVAQMSPSHFAHLFKRATGLAPYKYVTVCRMEHAKQLLSDTELPLIEIGYRVGCADSSHFSALFRAQVGMSPTAYRSSTMMAA